MGLRSCLGLCLLLLLVAANSSADPQDHDSTAVSKHVDRRGKALRISKRPCTDPNGQRGVCTFKWDCINHNGTLMGTCVDGFIFGTCCRYDGDPPPPTPTPDTPPFQDNNEIEDDDDKPGLPTAGTAPPSTTPPAPTTHESPVATAAPANAATSSGTPPPPAGQQLVTWTSIGPTRAPQRPILLLPFRPGAHFGPGGGWPAGVAFPVDPFQTNRPLQVFGPSVLLHHQDGQGQTHVTHAPAANGSHAIPGEPDKTTTINQGVEMTTVSVPIPQWSTESQPDDGRPQALSGGNFSSAAQSSPPTGRPSRVPLDYRKDCGVRAVGAKARIVGGQSASFGRWPWQVLVKEAAWLGLYQKNKCGGVLVSSKYAVTAGHCQPGRFLSALVVILGEYDLLRGAPPQGVADERTRPEVRRVKRMIVHRHYNPQNFDNDIAMLELDTPVRFRPHISPVCLPRPDEDFTGRLAHVTGWGKTSHGGVIPNLLQEVRVPVLGNVECLAMFRAAGHAKLIKDTFLCAGYETGGKDSCEGDSGGPLMVEREETGQWVLVGTVSHGIRCADPNLPGVYMKISAYRSWIDKIIAK